MSDITININGGNNQILPNATEAVQNFYGSYFPEHPLPDKSDQETEPPEAQKLALYINKENLGRYLSLIGECRSAGYRAGTCRGGDGGTRAQALPRRNGERTLHQPPAAFRVQA